MRYTSNQFIEAIKRNAGIPTSQRKFSNDDFLKFLNEELQLTIVGELVDMRQDYFIETVTTALVANQGEYSFPTTSIGWKVDSVGYLNSSGDYTKLSKASRSQRDMYVTLSDSSSPAAYYIEGNKIVLLPTVGGTPDGSLEIDFVRLQNELVLTSQCGLSSLIADSSPSWDITVDTVPNIAGGVDVVSGTNPFDIIARGSSATSLGSIISIAQSDFTRDPVVGDYVCETGQTPIPNIPEDVHPVLAQAGTIRCLIAMNDQRGLQTAQLSYANMIERLRQRARQRVNSSPTKIVPRSSILNIMRYARRG